MRLNTTLTASLPKDGNDHRIVGDSTFRSWMTRLLLLLCLLEGMTSEALSQRPEILLQREHVLPIQCVAFSPDGNILAGGSWDGKISLWQADTGIELRQIESQSRDMILSVAFSPNGRILATGGVSGAIALWDVQTGARVNTLHSEFPYSLAFTPDGKALVSESGGGRITVWDSALGRAVMTIENPLTGWSTVAVSPNSRFIASGSGDNTVALWDISSGQKVQLFKGHQSAVQAVAFSPDGRTLASAGLDKSIRLWEIGAGREGARLAADYEMISSLAFSSDGRLLAVAGEGASSAGSEHVAVWDLATHKQFIRAQPNFSENISVAFSSKNLVAFGNRAGNARMLDIATGKERVFVSSLERVTNVAFQADGLGLTALSGTVLRHWDFRNNTEPRAVFLTRDSPEQFQVVLSPDANVVAMLSSETEVRIADSDSGKTHAQIKLKFPPSSDLEALLPPAQLTRSKGQSFNVSRLYRPQIALNATGRTLITTTPIISDFKIDSIVSGLPSEARDQALAAAKAAGGFPTKIVTGTTIHVWDTSSGRLLQTINAPDLITAVSLHPQFAISPNGDILAAISVQNARLRLWNLRTGQPLAALDDATNAKAASTWAAPFNIAFSPDGQFLVCVYLVSNLPMTDRPTSEDVKRALRQASDYRATGEIQLWRLDERTLFKKFSIESSVDSVVVSRDGKILAAALNDSSIKIFDTQTGSESAVLPVGAGSLSLGSFSPDARLLMTVGDRQIKLWDVRTRSELANLVAFGERDWLAMTPNGLFDGSPNAFHQILWRFSSQLSDVMPIESFFNEFFYPNLLSDIIEGKRPTPTRIIAQKDRRQPLLSFEATGDVSVKRTARELPIKINVTDAGAGAQDVRLFRNGSLVKVWPGNVLKGQSTVTLETTIPIIADENKLTAYAFNRDNIKSRDATLIVTGADNLKRQGTLYMLAIGVGRYANRNYNLDYTPEDATSFAAQLKLEQEKLRQYKSVAVSTLLNENATKQNVLTELKKLSATVQPEDAVVVYFSGHGKADGDHFYLIPHDLGYSGPRDSLSTEGLRQILANSISDVELEEAFRGIDAGQIFMIIDACNSGQALENKDEPRRGSMNTRGLAQLAYEKGMYIMAASQNVEEAFVSLKLKHSYLTFAMVEEGLKTKVADENGDGQVTLREWFDYASIRVPKLREETLQSKSLEEVTSTLKGARAQRTQTPRPFYRRELETQPFIVAKP